MSLGTQPATISAAPHAELAKLITNGDRFGSITFNDLSIGASVTGWGIVASGIGVWESADGLFNFYIGGDWQDTTLIIVHRESRSRIRVENWTNGELGSHLSDLPTEQLPETGIFSREADVLRVGRDKWIFYPQVS